MALFVASQTDQKPKGNEDSLRAVLSFQTVTDCPKQTKSRKAMKTRPSGRFFGVIVARPKQTKSRKAMKTRFSALASASRAASSPKQTKSRKAMKTLPPPANQLPKPALSQTDQKPKGNEDHRQQFCRYPPQYRCPKQTKSRKAMKTATCRIVIFLPLTVPNRPKAERQ